VSPGALGGDDDQEFEIDLDNKEHVDIINQEFQKLYENDARFKEDFGDDMLELEAYQKFQILDAYKNGGMEAVMALLKFSVDQSQNQSGVQ